MASYTNFPGGAHHLRQCICDYLEEDPVLFDGDVTVSRAISWSGEAPSLQHYVERMRLSSTWGGATEIKAFADMMRCEVGVKDLRTGRFMKFRCRRSVRNPPVRLEWSGDHFEPGSR